MKPADANARRMGPDHATRGSCGKRYGEPARYCNLLLGPAAR
ncbi:ABC transporter related protein [Rhizobium etli CNPAF512]|nr:ABC transporter related protein [Rhizobium etli CNPAF512]